MQGVKLKMFWGCESYRDHISPDSRWNQAVGHQCRHNVTGQDPLPPWGAAWTGLCSGPYLSHMCLSDCSVSGIRQCMLYLLTPEAWTRWWAC